MEFCGLGSCRDLYQRRKKGFTEKEAQSIVRDMVLGLYHIHNQGIIHRSIRYVLLLLNISLET